MPDEQDEAEMLDDDEIDIDNFPPDHPGGVADLLFEDVNAAGEFAPDTLAERSWREEPDVIGRADEIGRELPGRITDPDDSLGSGAARTGELIGEEGEADNDVADDLDLSDSPGYGHGSDRWSAEEAALHIEDGPDDPTITQILTDNDDLYP